MKTFRYAFGGQAGKTMTVGELRKALDSYPDDLPVMATWEGVHAYVDAQNFLRERVTKGHPSDTCDCLVIDVEHY